MHVYDWYWSQAHPLDLLIVDEAQFLGSRQVDGLGHIADEAGVDVRAFGLLADFATELFVGSKRLVELADVLAPLPLSTSCWCGRDGVMHARVVGGRMVTSGIRWRWATSEVRATGPPTRCCAAPTTASGRPVLHPMSERLPYASLICGDEEMP